LLEIDLEILLRKTGARLNFKITLMSLHIDQGNSGKCKLQPFPFTRCPGSHFHEVTSKHQYLKNVTVTVFNKDRQRAKVNL
jgi:hypothetical protein